MSEPVYKNIQDMDLFKIAAKIASTNSRLVIKRIRRASKDPDWMPAFNVEGTWDGEAFSLQASLEIEGTELEFGENRTGLQTLWNDQEGEGFKSLSQELLEQILNSKAYKEAGEDYDRYMQSTMSYML